MTEPPGTLMAAGIELGHIFWLAIIPTLVCAVAVTLLRLAVNRSAITPPSAPIGDPSAPPA